MNKRQRGRLELFGRIRNFGVANRDVFPEESAAGKRFGQLAVEVKVIEDHLVRQGVARSEARKIKLGTRQAAMAFMKAVASAGRRASVAETSPHPFRLPVQRSATVVLATARLFMTEAERRKERFADLGLPPTFLADFSKAVDDLASAVAVQQDSRRARGQAQGTIAAAFSRGLAIVADLDVAVPATLALDPGRLAEWYGARRVDQPGSRGSDAPAGEAGGTTPAAAPADASPPAPVPVNTPPVAA